MQTITLEEHFTTPDYVKATSGSGGLQRASEYLEKIARKQADLGAERIADMDAAGIDVQVLSLSGIMLDTLDAAAATAIVRDANNRAAEAVRNHPTRFRAFAALGLKQPELAAEEFRRCVTELGFVGAIVNGTTDGAFLDDPRFTPIFEAAQELGRPIYLHPAPPPQAVQEAYYSGLPDGYGQMLSIAGWGWHVETGMHALRLMLAGIFDRFPSVQVIIGHMGENLPFSLARAQSVFARAPKGLTRPLTDYFRSHFYVTTSGYFTLPPFLCALLTVGADRLLFSVDYPFSENTAGKAFLNSLPITETDRAKIGGENAARLLKIAPMQK